MIFILGSLILSLSGVCISYLLKISRNHLIFDMAIGWFLGATFYAVTSFILGYVADVPSSPTISFLIVLVPILFVVARYKLYIPTFIQSFKNIKKCNYLEDYRYVSFDTIIIAYSVFVILIIFLHGASTPTSADDALHLRAYTPMLVYENNFSWWNWRLVLGNGIFTSFLTVFHWHLLGWLNHFYINYTILTSVISFMLILYLAPVLNGKSRQGIYNVFLVLALPFFIYHSTITYSDVPVTIPFSLGFLFFTSYLADLDKKDLITSGLFFLITSLMKIKGIFLGLTGLTILLTVHFYFIERAKKILMLKIISGILFLIILVIYLLRENDFSSHIDWYLGGIFKAVRQDSITLLYRDLWEYYLKPIITFQEINWSGNPFLVKLSKFYNSIFKSDNFNIIYYILVANIIFYFRMIFTTRYFMALLFLIVVFIETYFYFVVYFTDLNKLEDIIHRGLIPLSAIGAVFLASLWGWGRGDIEDEEVH